MPALIEQRFMKKVSPEPMSGCWLWTARCGPTGYGQFGIRNRVVGAHRFSYEMHKGPIPEGLELDHLCRVRSCVNPDHLEPVTHKVNMERGVGGKVNNRNLEKTHCKRGHEFTLENTYRNDRGWRYCRMCDAEKHRNMRKSN